MGYPNFENKHLHESLFSPKDYVKYRKVKRKNLPAHYILTYQRSAKAYFLRKFKPKKLKAHGHLDIYIHKGIGFVKMNGIGSPHAVTTFEELIALGGKEFLNIGTVGGLKSPGVFLCTKALRDEGTSSHYTSHEPFSYPDERLTNSFRKTLIQQNLNPIDAATWTIDAPYRETKAEIEHYRNKNIATVEMEASALFAVAKYRKVKIASAFVVSDILGEKWDPQFHKLNLKVTLNKLIDAGVSCLQKHKRRRY